MVEWAIDDRRSVERYRRYEVRCCCQPQKVLGTLPWPSDDMYASVCVPDPEGWSLVTATIELRTMNRLGPPVFGIGALRERIMEYVIYSEDRGIDFWRKLEGFEENFDVERD